MSVVVVSMTGLEVMHSELVVVVEAVVIIEVEVVNALVVIVVVVVGPSYLQFSSDPTMFVLLKPCS